jgi:hypothetical protein
MERVQINTTNTSWTDLLWRKTKYSENIRIEQSERKVTLKNIDFKFRNFHESILRVAYLNLTIKFEDCSFKLQNQDVLADLYLDNLSDYHIIFERCKINKLRALSVKRLHIKDSEINKLELDRIDRLRLDITTFQALTLSDSTIVNNLKIDELITERIKLRNCTFLETIVFDKVSSNNWTLNDLKFKKEVRFIKINFSEDQLISGGEYYKLIINGCKGAEITIESATLFNLHAYRLKNSLAIQNCTLKEGKINLLNTAKIHLEDNNIDSLLFSRNSSKDFNFDRQDISKIDFENNTGTLHLNEIESDQLPDFLKNNFEKISITKCTNNNGSWNLNSNKTSEISFSENQLNNLTLTAKAIKVLILLNNQVKTTHLSLEGHTSISFENNNLDTVFFNDSAIQTIELTNGSAYSFSIQNTQVNNFLQSETKVSDFNLTKSTIQTEKLKNKNSKLSLLSIQETRIEYLNIEYSKIEDVLFKNVRFNKATLYIPNLEKIGFMGFQEPEQSITFGPSENPASIHLKYLPIDLLEIRNSVFNKITAIDEDFEPVRSYAFEITNVISQELEFIDLCTEFIHIFNGEFSKIQVKHEALESPEKETGLTLTEVNIDKLLCDAKTYSIGLFKCHFNFIEFEDFNSPYIGISECYGNNENSKVLFHGGDHREIKINKFRCNTLELNEILFGDFSCKNSEITNLSLNSIYPNVDTKKFEFNYLNDKVGAKAKHLVFHDSDLSLINFNSCYFKTFESLDVNASKLDKITCTGTNWPKSVISSREENSSFEVREACRQLKLAMSNHQDKANELHFHSLEMKAYRKNIKEGTSRGQSWNDKFALWGGATNDFGMNWSKPLILLFISVNIAFGLMVTSETKSVPFSYDWNCASHLSDYFTLYNPAHRLDHLTFGKEANGTIATVDFLIRVLSAFFIYQMVAAFRKFRR